MKCRLIAAGTRLPTWVNEGFNEYRRRLRTPLALELVEIPIATRSAGEDPLRPVVREGERMLAAIRSTDHVVALEVMGQAKTTDQVSSWLAERLRDAQPLVLLIGGPDGLADAVRRRADHAWSLSAATLPHGLVRILLAEQLYRAMSLLSGHPYHRA